MMTTKAIEIGKRKLRIVAGAYILTIPLPAVKMLQLQAGDIMSCSLNGDMLEIERSNPEE